MLSQKLLPFDPTFYSHKFFFQKIYIEPLCLCLYSQALGLSSLLEVPYQIKLHQEARQTFLIDDVGPRCMAEPLEQVAHVCLAPVEPQNEGHGAAGLDFLSRQFLKVFLF